VLHILKKYSEAISCYDAVLDHDKRNAMALAYKGLTIGEMGNIPSAIKYFKKALCMEQDYDLAQISLLTAKNILKNMS
jgi:tetratricopeptide (TPR) repeat protein